MSPLVESMRQMLGARFNAHLESIYTRAFRYLVTELCRGYDALPDPPDELDQEQDVPVASGGGSLSCSFRGTSSPTPSPPGSPSKMLALQPSPSALVLSSSELSMPNQQLQDDKSEKPGQSCEYSDAETSTSIVFSPHLLALPTGRCPFISSEMTTNFKNNAIALSEEQLCGEGRSCTSTAATTSSNASPVPPIRNGPNQVKHLGALVNEPSNIDENHGSIPILTCPFSRGMMIGKHELVLGFGKAGAGDGDCEGVKRRGEQTPFVREGSGDSGLERERAADRDPDSDHQQQHLVDGVLALNISGLSAPVCPFASIAQSCAK